ncbi:MAG: PmoA family protein [Mariniblastus sp.]|nr:PmoA family protein [Mariniblastus sp.]
MRFSTAGLLAVLWIVFVGGAFQEDAATLGDEPVIQGNVSSPTDVMFEQRDVKTDVLVGGKLFTSLDFSTYKKPILYPIYAPGQIPMTRSWPMVASSDGESRDHPHHKSLWTAHEINGIDFWGEKGGIIKTVKLETAFVNGPPNAIRTTSHWLKQDHDTPTLTDRTTYLFGGDDKSRWINVHLEFEASDQAFQFDDTKEGLFAIRTHPDLRLKANPKGGVSEVFGRAMNSEGVRGKEIWGKKSKWLLYFGKIQGKSVAIAMYDHPSNLRHPTTWHARDYGLIAANPFGLHHFLGQKKGSGAYQVKKGDQLNLRYRIEFFQGEVTTAEIESRYRHFAEMPAPQLVPLEDR